MSVKPNYPRDECPDCCEPIPDEAEEGEECENCGHVFTDNPACHDQPDGGGTK